MATIRRRLRRLAWRLTPSLTADRDRRQQLRVRTAHGVPAEVAAYLSVHGATVARGPLAGLRYPEQLLLRTDEAIRKLAGQYEPQLSSAIAEAVDILRASDGTFVDVGASEGFYAVGIARAGRCRTVAFEAARSGRREIALLAAANDAEIEIRGVASETSLLDLAPKTTVLLVDVEGAELQILTSRVARALEHAQIIVELHGAAATADVPARLRATHEVEMIEGRAEGFRVEATPWAVARPRETRASD